MSEVTGKENGFHLKNIKGVGEKLSNKIVEHVDGESNLEKIVKNLDLDKISSIEGISQRKAIEIFNQLLGNPAQKFLKSEKAFQLYEEVIEKILDYSNTKYAENRILLMSPSKNRKAIEERLKFVTKAKEKVSKLPIIKLRGLMRNLQLPAEVKPSYDPSKAILVESHEDFDHLLELGLNNHYPILVLSEDVEEELKSYETIFYVYSQGYLDVDYDDNLIMISKDSPAHEIVPDIILNYFNVNQDLFKRVLEIRKILNKDTKIDEVLTILDEIESLKIKDVDLDEVVSDVKKSSDNELKIAIKNIDIDGTEVLDLLNNAMPPKIEKIFDEIITKGKTTIKELSGIGFDPFLKTCPLQIDDEEIERVKRLQSSKAENELFDKKINGAKQLFNLKEMVEEEIKEILEFDFEFSLGCFAYEYNLNPFKISDNFKLNEVLHLNLILEKSDYIQRINYDLSYPENVVLLTGANSGGKTTLLETISQISIMAQMGLPVSGKDCEIKLLDEIYHFSKKRSLDAGALESFLNVFIPIVTTNNEKLILLDELEGITELEAAVKIISSFIKMIKDSNSYGVIVTHMAKELMKYTDIRVDGIEAKGLDENYNLVVDRTPKMNFLAKSTPELILKRIYENSEGKLKEVYGEILKKF
ncbi:MAG: endonuclease MutS2 [Methanobrevibacter sp.]|jgi:dsDNA-specific endonuclease/ATPase MutS2|nr:endonuclease MutS2 [Candidatus Methanovirga aequatorialis]